METTSTAASMPALSRRTRQAGAAILVGGLVYVGFPFLGTGQSSADGTLAYTVTGLVGAIAAALVLVGLYGLHARYGDEYGRFGLATTILSGLAFALVVVGMTTEAIASSFQPSIDVGGTAWFLGTVAATLFASLSGLALWRSGFGSAAIVLAATLPLALVVAVVGDALVGDVGASLTLVSLTWAVVGFAMTRNRAAAETVDPTVV